MKLQFFNIPALDSSQATKELNSFCSQHKINAIEKQFVNDGANSYWAICVSYIDSQDTFLNVSTSKGKKTIDYKEVLNDDDFTIYSQLRDFRKMIAEREGTPPYNVFTNEQLAKIVQQRVTNKTGLLALEGIGQTRVDKYGELFINQMNKIIGGVDKEE